MRLSVTRRCFVEEQHVVTGDEGMNMAFISGEFDVNARG